MARASRSVRGAVSPQTVNGASSAPAATVADGGAATGDRLTRVAARAYAIYESRGGTGGSHLDDWLQAEREVDAASDERGSTAGAASRESAGVTTGAAE